MGNLLCFGDQDWKLHNFTMSGQFSTHIITSLFAGLVISFPYVFWELWRFIKPALYQKETREIQFASSRKAYADCVVFQPRRRLTRLSQSTKAKALYPKAEPF